MLKLRFDWYTISLTMLLVIIIINNKNITIDINIKLIIKIILFYILYSLKELIIRDLLSLFCDFFLFSFSRFILACFLIFSGFPSTMYCFTLRD